MKGKGKGKGKGKAIRKRKGRGKGKEKQDWKKKRTTAKVRKGSRLAQEGVPDSSAGIVLLFNKL